MGNGLNLRTPGFMDIRLKTPLRYSTRANLNDAIDAETDKCNAAGKQSRNQRSNCFKAVVPNRRIAQANPSANEFFSGQLTSKAHCHSATRRSSWAFRATTTVLKDMRIAPTAGFSTIPHGSSTPAASGIATTL